MAFRNFAEALKICLTAENGSREQDEALVYCMEHAPEDLKELLKARFVEFHTGGGPGRDDASREEKDARHEEGCGCASHRKPKLSDFLR